MFFYFVNLLGLPFFAVYFVSFITSLMPFAVTVSVARSVVQFSPQSVLFLSTMLEQCGLLDLRDKPEAVSD